MAKIVRNRPLCRDVKDKWIGVLSHQELNFDVEIVKIPIGEEDKDIEVSSVHRCAVQSVSVCTEGCAVRERTAVNINKHYCVEGRRAIV